MASNLIQHSWRKSNRQCRRCTRIDACVLIIVGYCLITTFAARGFDGSTAESHWENFLPAWRHEPDYCTEQDTAAKNWISRLYTSRFNSLRARCANVVRVGASTDGGKLVCTDTFLDEGCVVYSLGSNLEFSFELDAYNKLGCEIFTFDCTVGEVENASIPSNIQFHPWCIGGQDERKVISSNFGHTGEFGQYLSLETVMRKLNHSRIDLLKMDIERHELSVIKSLSKPNAPRQVVFETHLHNAYGIWHRPMFRYEWITMWKTLTDLGYRAFSYEPNPMCLCCCEWSIKLS